MTNYDTVILDIEGTITPITFVKETLVGSAHRDNVE
jgi:enolase-phosphatase E1